MNKYIVRQYFEGYIQCEVEAENDDECLEKAEDIFGGYSNEDIGREAVFLSMHIVNKEKI